MHHPVKNQKAPPSGAKKPASPKSWTKAGPFSWSKLLGHTKDIITNKGGFVNIQVEDKAQNWYNLKGFWPHRLVV
ncbi:hypothetical protein COU95_01855 [Candidatus Shapirobacteria bacterium CG10_big_fil_rev_8_21_14_0_10_40_9]|uniref:Uncharacterized protein n=1 Tax=Candidatus Shapirobacteria bacterium CG10_big_fil_rev_8_21_14_0_10_40_9 TaxID=1974888 RepID=A0A2M8L3P9_9BACT|nr:MAG: hypothetical protein COU95_01855 [Candidatus Shapirobacteria bacterium CG10_big_fil_rev_8_21_14_0_10_40_9]